MSDCAPRYPSELARRVAGRSSSPSHGSAETCDKCDYWNLRGVATPPTTVYGYCDLFHKLTEAKHGTKCIAWTPRNPPPNQDERLPPVATVELKGHDEIQSKA